MENKIRVEYLFPNINNERVYKWLENAPFLYDVKDSKVADFTFDDFVEKLYNIEIQLSGYSARKKHKLAMERYNDWKHNSCCSHSDLINLDFLSVRWDNDLTRKLALHLEANPLLLPYFIQKNSADIIGLFLDEEELSKYLHSQKNGWALFLWQDVSDKRYRKDNFEAKYKLSLFLSVLNNLLDLGVNLDEYKFGCLEFSKEDNTFNKLNSSGPWSEYIISEISRRYRRYDGRYFTKDELIHYLDVSNLNDFLDKVIELTEIEGFYSYIKESKILNSNQICSADVGRASSDMLAYPDEKLVDVKDACKNMQKKLKHVALKTQIRILTRKLDDIKNLIEKHTEEQKDDYDSLKKIIEDFYKDITDLPLNIQEQFKTMVNELLKNKNKQVTFEKSRNVVNNSEDKNLSSTKEILKRIEILEKRMSKTEKEIKEMKQEIVNYLEHGGENPLTKNTGLSKEEVIKIISEYNPTTISSKWRKMKVIVGLMATGALGMIAGNNLIENKESVSPNICRCVESTNEELEIQFELKIPVEPMVEMTEERILSEEEKQVIYDTYLGVYGDGDERIKKLTEEGYDYDLIQSYVNKLIYGDITIEELNKQQFIK